MKRKIMLKMLLVAIVICFSCLLSCFVPTVNSGKICYSASVGIVGSFSNIVDDLQQDKTFSFENYVVDEDDYSLSVIRWRKVAKMNYSFMYTNRPPVRRLWQFACNFDINEYIAITDKYLGNGQKGVMPSSELATDHPLFLTV